MTEAELLYYREKLEALADRLGDDISGLNEEGLRRAGGEMRGNLSNVPLHPADLGSDSFEQDTCLGLLEAQSRNLAAVNEALRRARAGTYGRCLHCGGEIPPGRLEARPEAALCVSCARRSEAHRPLVETPGRL